ncbi:ABC transporter ATP-binding protein [Winogradskya humida]|uniref:ABC transporter ATP-binding protein n=1 Tax=Winogradskya humida TaxID=113566 RepID=A0ABQ3ZWF8_9ACTN|nr:ABC transporter ATP-binding protein [Actinoplanes humidus]GIE22901.1 ABC transporter ATP-binding protein [Actinoplanes humidus]
MQRSAISVRGLSVSYGSTPVLVDVDLTVAEGAGVCITGENGIGKSTLLRCISSLQSPDAGEIEVFGGPPGSTPEFWRAVATTVEPPTWYPGLTAREHAELVCRAHGVDAEESGVDEALERFGLASHADAIPPSLSSGQKQRLTLALILLRPSKLLILDEPEQRLDPDGRATVAAMIAEYLAGGGSVLMASHDDVFSSAAGMSPISMTDLHPVQA